MFLEDTQIDLPYSVDAIARKWSIHGIADQSVRLFVGDTLASPSTVSQIVNYPNHAQAEAGSPFERLADDAFSWSISHNLRISEEIRQFGTIRPLDVVVPQKVLTTKISPLLSESLSPGF